jgi:phosphoserine phosphatase RsbU/P
MVCDENGKPYRIVGSHLDITERKNVELRLMQREASLIADRNILDHLIPLDPYDSPGLLIQGSRFAADYAPGDYYDYFTLEDGSVLVVIADVSGHGIESALLMSSDQARLRSYAELSLSMEEILRRTNSVLFRSTSEGAVCHDSDCAR